MIGTGIDGLAYRLLERKEAGYWGRVVAAIFGAHLLIAIFRFIGFKGATLDCEQAVKWRFKACVDLKKYKRGHVAS